MQNVYERVDASIEARRGEERREEERRRKGAGVQVRASSRKESHERTP